MPSAEMHPTSGASTLLDVLEPAQQAGYGTQFIVVPDGRVRCGACRSEIAAACLDVHREDRLEGASDAADLLLVARLQCSACGARGVVTLGYGPNASPADVDVLGQLPRADPSNPATQSDGTQSDGTVSRSMSILVAVDSSDASRTAAATAFEMFGSTHDYTIISVASPQPTVVPGFGVGGATTFVDMTARLDEVAAQAADLAAPTLPDDADTLTDIGDPGRSICETAAAIDADLIVIGSHDHGFWDRLLDPPVGRYVTEHAPCPVLVVR